MVQLAVGAAVELTGGSILDVQMHREIADAHLYHLAGDNWPVESRELPEELVAFASEQRSFSAEYLVRYHEALLHINTHGTDASVEVYARSAAEAADVLVLVRSVMPRVDVQDDDIEVSFWSLSAHGPVAMSRRIDAPSWEDIGTNYAGSGARVQLDRMMGAAFEPGVGGQLLLWSGQAGTGKTTALRALAREWRDWCSIHYITDPEVFFGERAGYLIQVLLGGEDEVVRESADGEEPRGKWRLIVLEDSGELLSKDAAAHVGKALGRLLNTVDGLIGRGLRIMVLVTTNEEVGKLHEAIARPGRCAVNIEFTRLSGNAAGEWRRAHGLPSSFADATLAELYGELEGFQTAEQRKPVGFAA